MDPASQLQALFNNPSAMRQMIEETVQSAQTAAPQINVPVRDVPAPVELRGDVQLWIRFPFESIAGLSVEEVQDRVRQTLQGERSPWLPQIILGDIRVWRERVVEPTAEDGNVARGLLQARHPDDSDDGRDYPDGADIGEAEREIIRGG